NRFAAGHRLRLDISSADFPKFERNNNRGGPGPSVAARQTIYHDAEHPSHLLLPVSVGDFSRGWRFERGFQASIFNPLFPSRRRGERRSARAVGFPFRVAGRLSEQLK